MKKTTNKCAVENCTKEHYAKNYCKNHYSNNRRCGNPLGVHASKTPTFCHCGKQASTKGMCRNHYNQQWYKNHPEAYQKMIEQGKNYVRPDGLPLKPYKEVVGYHQAHKRIRYVRGRASEYACVDCGGPAQQWALINGSSDTLFATLRIKGVERVCEYSLDVNDYEPKCMHDHLSADHAYRRELAMQ